MGKWGNCNWVFCKHCNCGGCGRFEAVGELKGPKLLTVGFLGQKTARHNFYPKVNGVLFMKMVINGGGLWFSHELNRRTMSIKVLLIAVAQVKLIFPL